ncbi:hypothetical protein Lal_00012590 [Lupinus albus]|nr:hypothetical protein Lal_00012590 [Lupinus albus]
MCLGSGSLAQARDFRSSENLTASTGSECHFSPRRDHSRSSEDPLAQARILQYSLIFHLPRVSHGKPGHMKMDCPNIKKSSFKGKNELKNGRRAYIAWEDNDTSSTSEPESEEQAHLSLMASHHSDDEESQKIIFSIRGETICYINRLL